MTQDSRPIGSTTTAPPRAIANSVIVAENDALMRGVIRTVLLRAEQIVFPAVDGQEAVQLAREFRSRLVLLDIAMPRLNGLLACEAIRALPGYATVPIVILTGHCDDRLREAAQRLGANAFITKPFRPNVLLAQLAAYLDLPAHVLPAAPISDNDALPGARAQVWKVQKDPRSSSAESPQLTEGREMMQIYRKAERKD
jgi:CheY-like chemotaxis protein